MQDQSSVFDFTDYTEFLKKRLRGSRGSVTQVAAAAGCQRSYLSRVLSGTVHLTPDHAYGLSRYFEFTDRESEYFLILVDHARAGSRAYRGHLEKRLEAMRKENEDLSTRLQRPQLEAGEKEFLYYSAWYWSAIHIAVSIPELQTPEAIGARLQLPVVFVRSCLETLERFGLVRRESGRWVYSSGEFHLPNASPIVGLHHQNWRVRAVLDAQTSVGNGIHYTVVQSMSRVAYEELRRKILALIDESAKIAGPSKEELLVCFTNDFFAI